RSPRLAPRLGRTGPAARTERLWSDHRAHHHRPGHRRPRAPPDRNARRADRHRHRPHTPHPPTPRRRGGGAAGPPPRAGPGRHAMTAPAPAGPPPPPARRLRPADLAPVASVGLRTPQLPAALSAPRLALAVG